MNEKITLSDIIALKNVAKKFAVISCYDYLTAQIASSCGVEAILVGDSAAQVVLGYPSTLYAKMDFMVEITAAARRGAPNCYLIADMPFISYHTGKADALKNAARFITEAGADIVKLEMNESYLDIATAIANAGIAVMPHIGIRPQTGVFHAQGRTVEQAIELINLAERAVKAGASMLLLEGVAAEVSDIITKNCPVPVIGCGSGVSCDGNVLIAPDILGLSEGKKPKFSKSFSNIHTEYKKAFTEYSNQIKKGLFPDDEHSYHINKTDLDSLKKIIEQNQQI